MLERAVEEKVAPGGALVALVDGERHCVAAGLADVATTDPMRGDERFRIGSVTKTFVAALVLRLADQDALTLDDPVAHWLGGALPNAATMTIHHLLTHTSGLANYTDDPRVPLIRFKGTPLSPEQLLAVAASRTPLFLPGERFSYSNSNFIALGLIAEAAAGWPLEDQLRRLLKPLAPTGTAFPRTPAISGRHARGYVDEQDQRLQGRPPTDFGIPRSLDVTDANPAEAWASGAMISTIDDVARFFSAYLGGQLLNRVTTREITAAARDRHGEPTVSGIGVVRLTLPCGEAWGKGGEMPGYVTRVVADRDGRRIVVAMLNRSGERAVERVIALSQTAFCLVADS